MQTMENADAKPLFESGDIIKQIKHLVKDPVLLPFEHAQKRVLPWILATIVFCTFIYLASTVVANKVIGKSSSPQRRHRFGLQMVSILINSCLGLAGFYYEYWLLPMNASVKERIQGQDDFHIFSAVQIGYQAWSLVVGVFFINEELEMLLHHTAVVCVGCMSAFFTNGFRYWTPYFFGLFELSSVPLAFMNVWKENETWIRTYPSIFTGIQVSFAFSFLYIRIIMLMPRQFIYLRDSFLVPYLMDNQLMGSKIFLFVVWGSSCFLSVLQLFWASVIVSKVIDFVTKKVVVEKKFR